MFLVHHWNWKWSQVWSAGSQICPADLGDDLQQNLQEANDHKHHTVLHQIYQVDHDIDEHICQMPKTIDPFDEKNLSSSAFLAPQMYCYRSLKEDIQVHSKREAEDVWSRKAATKTKALPSAVLYEVPDEMIYHQEVLGKM